MSKITIEINTGNAAFEDAPGHEVARILTETSALFRQYEDLPTPGTLKLRDNNGNVVGHVTVEDDNAE